MYRASGLFRGDNMLQKIVLMAGTVVAAIVMVAVLNGQKSVPYTQASPSLTDGDKAAIRKYQLDDARLSNSIQQRWLVIYQTTEFQQIVALQKQQEQNSKGYLSFIAGLCKEPGWQFSLDNDDPKCAPVPKPSPTPTTTPKPAEKK